MTPIEQMAEIYKISQSKLRKLKADGYLRIPADNGQLRHPIAHRFINTRHLSAETITQVLLDESIQESLGSWRDPIMDYIRDTVGDDPQPAPLTVPLSVRFDDIGQVKDWIKEVLPDYPVSYAWLAVRILMGSHPNGRPKVAKKMHKAFAEILKSDDFAGWWTRGNFAVSYHRPQKSFDL